MSRASALLAALAAAALLGACGGKDDGSKKGAGAPGGNVPVKRYTPDGKIDVKPTATPNVVLVVLSGVRYDLALEAGSGAPAMPALSALAREGTSFTEATSPSAWAAPAFASVLTGYFPEYLNASLLAGSRVPPLVEQTVLLAEVLKSAGYATAGFVHASSGVGGAQSFGQGCETWNEDFRLEDGVDRVAAWLSKRPGGQPFFLLVHADDAAEPFTAKSHPPEAGSREKYLRTAVDTSLVSVDAGGGVVPAGEVPTLLRALLTDPESAARVRSSVDETSLAKARAEAGAGSVLRGPRGDELAREVRERYVANLGRVDRLLASLLAKVDAAARPEDTVLIVASDHGVALGEEHSAAAGEPPIRRFGGGGSVFDEHVHVPLVIRAPKRLSAHPVGGACGLVDLLATTLDFLGLPAPAETNGHSLIPLVEKPASPAGVPAISDEITFVKTADGHVEWRRTLGARAPRSKVVFAYDEVSTRWTEAFFDLASDPKEASPRAIGKEGPPDAALAEVWTGIRDHLSGHSRFVTGLTNLGYGYRRK